MYKSLWPRFPPAVSSLVIDSFENRDDLLNNVEIAQIINNHCFAQTIQILSSSHSLKEELEATCSSFQYHLIKNVPVYLLIHKILIEVYLKKGKLFIVSNGTRIEFDDCVALLPNGKLILSVIEKSYHRLGLVGKKSQLFKNKNPVQKYVIEIDLLQSYFTPGTKNYERTFACLRRIAFTFDLLIKWLPNEELQKESISCQSIVRFFELAKTSSEDDTLQSMQAFRCQPQARNFTILACPPLLKTENSLYENGQALINWVGWHLCQLSRHNDEEISSFNLETNCESYNMYCCEISGFFCSDEIKLFLEKLNDEENSIQAVVVHGNENAIVTWLGKNNEHGKCLSGENLYGVVVDNLNKCNIIWRQSDDYDFGIERL